MSELKSDIDEMEKTNYSMNSNIDPKNNEELIIYVSLNLILSIFTLLGTKAILKFIFLGSELIAERTRQISVHE